MATFPVKKKLWPVVSRFNECDKLQGTIYKGPQASLTTTVEPMRAFF